MINEIEVPLIKNKIGNKRAHENDVSSGYHFELFSTLSKNQYPNKVFHLGINNKFGKVHKT